MERSRLAERTPVEVVEQSYAPSQALMVFVLHALADGGFEVSSIDWPLVTVDVGGCEYTLGVGGHPRGV